MKKKYISRTGNVYPGVKLILLLVLVGIWEKSLGYVTNDYGSVTAGNWLGMATATSQQGNGSDCNSSAALSSKTAKNIYSSHAVSAAALFTSDFKFATETLGAFTLIRLSSTEGFNRSSIGILRTNFTLKTLVAFTNKLLVSANKIKSWNYVVMSNSTSFIYASFL